MHEDLTFGTYDDVVYRIKWFWGSKFEMKDMGEEMWFNELELLWREIVHYYPKNNILGKFLWSIAIMTVNQ